jgi:hypothetical protein
VIGENSCTGMIDIRSQNAETEEDRENDVRRRK